MRGTQNKKIIRGCWILKSKWFKLRDILRRKDKASHILMFHQIRENESDCVPGDFSVDVHRFEHILRWHEQHGYRFLPIDDVGKSKIKKSCIITFDDGYDDVLLLALSVLRKYYAPFCVYIITDRIGQPGYLNAQQIQQLAKDPLCTIGSHTCTHPYTRYLTEQELKNELSSSKAALEKILLGKQVDHFAFPYGTILACSFFDRKYVKEAGYTTAVLTNQVPLHGKKTRRFALPRFDASRKDILEVI